MTAGPRASVEGPIELVENGVRFLADLGGGQKTGWFFDQRDNRAMVARAGGRRPRARRLLL